MKLEPWKSYRTADGRRAIVEFKHPNRASNEFVGRVYGEESVYSWSSNGSYSKISATSHDLISEWSEPKLRPWKMEEVPLGAWVRNKVSKTYKSIIIAVTECDCIVVAANGAASLYNQTSEEMLNFREHSTDNGKTWLPCGVIE